MAYLGKVLKLWHRDVFKYMEREIERERVNERERERDGERWLTWLTSVRCA